jgi:hypothetical protein
MGLLTEASQWPYRGIYRGSPANVSLMHGGIYLKKIEFWLLRDNKKNGLLYCFNAVGKEIEYGRD